MSVAVITERAVVPGRERMVLNLLRKLQTQASAAPGFVSSIAYRDLESPQKLVVISKWTEPAAWNSWARTLERSTALDEMREHLFGPISHRILLEEKEEAFPLL